MVHWGMSSEKHRWFASARLCTSVTTQDCFSPVNPSNWKRDSVPPNFSSHLNISVKWQRGHMLSKSFSMEVLCTHQREVRLTSASATVHPETQGHPLTSLRHSPSLYQKRTCLGFLIYHLLMGFFPEFPTLSFAQYSVQMFSCHLPFTTSSHV